MTRAWALVTGDIARHGGQDRANFELACYLADRRDAEVHLVTHRVDPELAAHSAVRVHLVPRPLHSVALGEPLLAAAARRVAARLRDRHGVAARVVVNGGNCPWPDVNWVHSVHAAWPVRDEGAPLVARAKNRLVKWAARRAERVALGRARLVLANSRRTRADLIERVGMAPERVHVVYLGVDSETCRLPDEEERRTARRELRVGESFPVVAFVGALGYDANKGLDTLLAAWARLRAAEDFRGLLLAVGGGRLSFWQRRIDAAGLSGSVRLLGSSERVSTLLAAADLLVAPSRYEAFGLAVQEALCRGVPALVPRSAGVAERYPPELDGLLLDRPDDAEALAERFRLWRLHRDRYAELTAGLGERLRIHTWRRMAEEMVELIESTPARGMAR